MKKILDIFCRFVSWGLYGGVKCRQMFSTSSYQSSSGVIGVGNISLGGNGKTSFVIYIVEKLLQRGLKMAVLTRGYGRKTRKDFILPPNQSLTDQLSLIYGDEVALMSYRCPDLWVGVSGNRKRMLDCLQQKVDCFVLDDSFQQFSIAFDLQIVLINALDYQKSHKPWKRKISREPISSLKRADIVMVIHKNLLKDKTMKLPLFLEEKKVFFIDYSIRSVYCLSTQDRHNISFLRGRRFLAFCAIACPESFFSFLKKNSLDVCCEIDFSDHQFFVKDDIQQLNDKAKQNQVEAFICTEKDAVKLLKHPLNLPVWVVQVDCALDDEDSFWKCVQEKVRGL